MWTKNQIKYHTEAAKRLGLIKDEVKNFIYSVIPRNNGIDEKDVINFVRKVYKKHGLVNDPPRGRAGKKEFCIVAFRENTKHVHYFPSPSKAYRLKPNTLILLDMWARLDKKDAPYADMTWMFFSIYQVAGKKHPRVESRKLKVESKIPNEIQKVWNVLLKARDSAISYIKKEVKKGTLPRGLDIDRVAHDVIGKAGYAKGIKHTVGHSLGLKHPHGELPGINWKEYSPLLKNVGYTIEPGIYLKDWGMRTEIDFYINSKNEVVVTTPIQKEIDLI